MPVAADIEQVLHKKQIQFGVVTAHPNSELISDGNTAKTSLLQDGRGKVQVICCADSLVDVDALCRLTNRELKTTPASDVNSVCQSIKTQRLPTVPTTFDADMVIDQRLMEADNLILDTGCDQCFITIKHDQFKRLVSDAIIGEIAITEDELKCDVQDDSNDIENITFAITNFTQIRMRQRLEDTLDFPPLPDSAQQIIKLRVDPNADIQDLTNIVEKDPSLASQVVSWAASPYYAAPGKIKSVHDAIVRVLGFDLVLNLSLGLALGKTLNLPKDAAKGFTPYWQQAVFAATSVEALVGTITPSNRPSMGMAYLSGLLHNFGYLILAEVFPPHFSSICRYQEANPFSNHCLIERHLLGVTREQLGAWLMRSWNMPEEVCTALRFQNEPDYEGAQYSYANLVFVAMHMLRTHGIGDASGTLIPETLFERLYLERDKAKEVVGNVIESSAELNAIAANMAA